MNPSNAGVVGVHTDVGGNEVHNGSGQGGTPSQDYTPTNLSRSGATHGPAGQHPSGAGSRTTEPAPSGIGESTSRLDSTGDT